MIAALLAGALRELPGCEASLSLAAGAEILDQPDAPECDWREPTYDTTLGYVAQRLAAPLVAGRTLRHLAELRPSVAVCAMPALLDSRMAAGLRRAGVPYAVMVHDAQAHPGDALSFRMLDQRRMLRGAQALFSLSEHVQDDLLRQGYGRDGQKLEKLWLPPISLGATPPPLRHGGRPRLLYFGRLLPYKGLDLLAEALAANRDFEVRVCGEGANSPSLTRLRALPGVSVEQRWFTESELPGLLAWADALVLPYREASQSGVASLAIAAGRYVLATNVGGLPEQLGGQDHALLCAPSVAGIAQGLGRLIALMQGDSRPGAVDAGASWRALGAAMMASLQEK
jgi:glycosyltransferase involved in cell wall biosynthesis